MGVGGGDLWALRLRHRRPARLGWPLAARRPAWRRRRQSVSRCAPAPPASTSRPCAPCTSASARARPGMLDRPGPWWEQRLLRPRGRAPRRPAAAGRARARRVRALRGAPGPRRRRPRGRGEDPRARRGDPGGARAAVGLPARPGPDADHHLAAGAGRRAAVAHVHRPRRGPHGLADRAVDCASSTSPPRWARAVRGRRRCRDGGRRRALPVEHWRYRLSAAAGAHRGRPPTWSSMWLRSAPRYLGGTTLRSLAAAGRVRELTPGAVARASAAFRGEVEPWCPEVF